MGYWKIKESKYLDYNPETMYNPMFKELFDNNKLVGLRTLSDITKLRFIYDDEQMMCNDSVVVLTLWYLFKDVDNITVKRTINVEKINCSKNYNYYYLQGILNSKLMKFYFNELFYDGTHFYPNHMKLLPIVPIENNKDEKVSEIVEQIHNKQKINLDIDINDLLIKLNSEVYRLYNLNNEEIKLIEGEIK